MLKKQDLVFPFSVEDPKFPNFPGRTFAMDYIYPFVNVCCNTNINISFICFPLLLLSVGTKWQFSLSNHSFQLVWCSFFFFNNFFFLVATSLYFHYYGKIRFSYVVSVGSQEEEKISCSEETKELMLDDGFPLPKAVAPDGFLVPEINSFGQSFRFELHFISFLLGFFRDF